MVGIGLATGLVVPTVFEWSQKAAARGRHSGMERAALVALAVSLVIAIMIWVLRRRADGAEELAEPARGKPIQFGIRHLLVAMTLVAIFAAAAQLIGDVFVPWIMMGAIAGLLGRSLFLGPIVRSRVAALMAAVFLPFAWIMPYSRPWGRTSGLMDGILFGPGILPATFLRRGSVDNAVWIAATIVLIELGLGFFLARRKNSPAFLIYAVMILLASSFSSLIFHAMFRM